MSLKIKYQILSYSSDPVQILNCKLESHTKNFKIQINKLSTRRI